MNPNRAERCDNEAAVWLPRRTVRSESFKWRSGALAKRVGSIALLLLVSTQTEAHAISVRFGDFYNGLLHPLITLEHGVAFVALGMLAGFQGAQSARAALLAFPVGLLCGVAGVSLAPPLDLNIANLASLTVLGALLASGIRLGTAVTLILALLFGFTHGAGNATELDPQANRFLFSCGVSAAGYLVMALVAAVSFMFAEKFSAARIALRAAGSWVAAVGVLMIGLALRMH